MSKEKKISSNEFLRVKRLIMKNFEEFKWGVDWNLNGDDEKVMKLWDKIIDVKRELEDILGLNIY